jgi:hypothetical protein
MLAVVLGLLVWIGCEKFYPEADIPPQLAGLFASFAGMIAGSLVPGQVPQPAHAGEHSR